MRCQSALLACALALGAPAAAAGNGRDGGGVAAPGAATLLTSFELRRTHLFLYGRAARVVFRLSGHPVAGVRVHVLRAGDRRRVTSLELGERAAGRHSVAFTGAEAGVLPEGRYLLHIAGRRLRRAPAAHSTAELEFRHHVFPLAAGSFSWGGPGSRFGAPRKGHSHQGHDLPAAEGTPIVAPRAGLVRAVGYQAGGAGHYLVLDGEAEDRDYVFMHLRRGSAAVAAGERVRTGERIGEVGSSGRSSGAHLHFEIWAGGWYSGGEPVDPLPHLEAWDGGRGVSRTSARSRRACRRCSS